jgi:hypothetical protein
MFDANVRSLFLSISCFSSFTKSINSFRRPHCTETETNHYSPIFKQRESERIHRTVSLPLICFGRLSVYPHYPEQTQLLAKMTFIRTCFILVVGFALNVFAHVQHGVIPLASCSDYPPAQSYHIHVLFWQNNANSTNSAINLQDEFMSHFNLSRDNDACPFEPGDTAPTSPMCVFGTDYEAAGPFLTAQTALFIPIADFERTVSWTVQRRGSLDVFVHPNSGCGIQDHLNYGLWAGNKWELDGSIFLH